MSNSSNNALIGNYRFCLKIVFTDRWVIRFSLYLKKPVDILIFFTDNSNSIDNIDYSVGNLKIFKNLICRQKTLHFSLHP